LKSFIGTLRGLLDFIDIIDIFGSVLFKFFKTIA